MKKTLSFLMGALLVALLPIGNANAQSKTVQVTVRTLDQAAVASATIYGDTVSGRTYFVDAAHFDTTYTGTAVSIDSMPYSTALTVGTDGITGTVDSATYAISAIVVTDVNGYVYVIGNVSAAGRTQGVFQASNLMLGATSFTASAMSNMLIDEPLINNRSYSYSTILAASTYALAGDTLRVMGNIAAGVYDTIVNPVVVNLAADTVSGRIVIAHTDGTVTILGGKLNAITGDSNTAPVVLKAIDSLGSYNPGLHTTAIESGNYGILYTTTGAAFAISGGCFTAQYPGLCANRFAFAPNTGANAAQYPYTIVPGYSVTWHNWDFLGNDTTIVYDQPDDKIRPVLGSPYAATSDTILVARFIDAAFTTPWDFVNHTLTSDTNLYVKWQTVGSGMGRYVAIHNRMDYNYQIQYSDTIVMVDTIGDTIIINKYNYLYYACDRDTAMIKGLSASGDTVRFHYYRLSYTLDWNLNGGQFTDGFGTTQTLVWGTPIDYSHTPVLEGHTFTGWMPNVYTTMPRFNLTLNAQYDYRLYGLTWTGVGGTIPYSGSAVTSISATYTDDNGNIVPANLRYIDNDGNTSTSISAVGSYRIIASSPDSNYHFNADTIRTIIIVPDTLTVVGTTVEDTKLYDGTYDAVVTNPGTLQTVHGNDQVTLTTTALFTDATPGDGKTIVAHYTISGADVASYVLDTNYAVIIRNSATIVAPIVPNSYYGPHGGGYYANNGFSMSYEGFCTDTATINFRLSSGNPDQYKLAFSANAIAEGFTDVAWSNTLNDTTIQFLIPTNAKSGKYTVAMTLRESAYPQYESSPINIDFWVNLDKDYVVAIFSDVLTVINKGELDDYDQYEWYCNGTSLGEYGQYYQDANGLSSSNYYYVELSSSTDATKRARTCPQSVVTVPTEDNVFNPTVTTFPNPTKDMVNVSVNGSTKDIHTLTVMNVMGQMVLSTTFSGNETNVDLNGLAQGTYTITVDGTTVRVIKK